MNPLRLFALVPALLLLPSCGHTPASMDEAIAELNARPECDDVGLEVEHVLIAFQGAQKAAGVTRSQDEAKKLAEEVWKRAVSGEDFTALRKQYSNDNKGGLDSYAMTRATRKTMVAAFGDVAWRLKPGEIGVAPFDKQKSPFGYHIIKRLK